MGGGRIGHFNFINVKSIKIGSNATIGKLNYIKGNVVVVIGDYAEIKICNKLTAPYGNFNPSYFSMGNNSSIQTSHIVDLTANVSIGNNVLFAGIGSQIWTHHFQMGKCEKWQTNEVLGDVVICDNVIVNSRCTICDNVKILSNIIVAANTCVYHDLYSPGLYVSSPTIYKKYDYEKPYESLVLDRSFVDNNSIMKVFLYDKKDK